MAARRVRIKGIANIPVRRKNEVVPNEKVDEKKDVEIKSTVGTDIQDSIDDNQKSTNDIENNNEKITTDGNEKPTESILTGVSDGDATTEKPSSLLSRRRISKPLVKLPAIIRKPKCDAQEYKTNDSSKQPENSQPSSDATTPSLDPLVNTPTEITNLEPPTCPLSPNKLVNRARIRPVPRLIRRSSVQGSTSESEDDPRKSFSRTRNDSICSITSFDVKEDNAAVKEKKIT